MANDDDKNTDAPIPLTAMTLRDHFAACALPSFTTAMIGAEDVDPRVVRCAAEAAYEIADAMLAERAKGGPR